MNLAYSVLKCKNENLELSDFERDMLYKKFIRKIDRVAFNNLGYTNHRALFVANCKLIIRVLLEHTDNSMNVWIGLEDLYELTDIPNKETLECIKFLHEVGVIVRYRGNGIKLIPPENMESSILDVYTAIMNTDEN